MLRRLFPRRAPEVPTPREPVDLAAIEALTLPSNERFLKVAGQAQKIHGMFSPLSMAVMDMMLAFQESIVARGDILEIGIFKGKSAALLGTHLRDGERLTLVDVEDILDPAAAAPFADKVDLILAPSSQLRTAMPRYEERRGTFRFIHIDASHDFEDTFHELAMAEELLAPRGIISMDDFANLHYAQNIAAIFKYLYSTPTSLMLPLVTDEKCYLCHKDSFEEFSDFVLRRALAEMQSRGITATLARTSGSHAFKAFYLRERTPEDDGAFYGRSIYTPRIVG